MIRYKSHSILQLKNVYSVVFETFKIVKICYETLIFNLSSIYNVYNDTLWLNIYYQHSF